MGTWERRRLFLKVLATLSASAAVISAAVGALPLAGILGAIATNAGALATDLPRDRWTDKERKEREVTPTIDPKTGAVYQDE